MNIIFFINSFKGFAVVFVQSMVTKFSPSIYVFPPFLGFPLIYHYYYLISCQAVSSTGYGGEIYINRSKKKSHIPTHMGFGGWIGYEI
jgi:hypothetical protein